MIKTILLILLGLFFILNGINHFFNTAIVTEYAHKRGIISPQLMVRFSGIALIFGGLSLMTGFLKLYGIIGLSIFLVITSFTIHRFWEETERDAWMLEVMHFAKNMAILTELIYIAAG
ncbi:MAG: DoxX family protein [Chloroflexota bacterium]